MEEPLVEPMVQPMGMLTNNDFNSRLSRLFIIACCQGGYIRIFYQYKIIRSMLSSSTIHFQRADLNLIFSYSGVA